ncbi:MAG: ribonucleoside-triphosphate reductase, adenosylcobalamin-dependent, partial [Romboutsia sp.]|nr:ribonucleoside-triphosphate reductase, adenosylcobalamin-dependent [Romboutsia sp.]
MKNQEQKFMKEDLNQKSNNEYSEQINNKSKYKFLTDEFLEYYNQLNPPMSPFGTFVYLRTYSRWIESEKRREYWWETVARAVDYNCSLVKGVTKKEAEKLYDNIFNLRQFLSGRTLYTGGTEASKLYPTSNFNCAFTIIDDFSKYGEIFYLLMVGAGVGFRLLKEDVDKLPIIRTNIQLVHDTSNPVSKNKRQDITSLIATGNTLEIIVGDSKEGWMDALDIFIEVFYSHKYRKIENIIMNYNNVRPAGERLKTFGGTSSGYKSMQTMISKIYSIFVNTGKTNSEYKKLKTIEAMDIANIVAENVVSGGVRRSALICLFDADDEDILKCKSELYIKNENDEWILNKDISHRQMSNNSIYYKERPSDEQIKWQIQQMRYSGEPAFINGEAISKRRPNGQGCNPCGEILLDNDGLCNLTTINLMAFVDKNGNINKEELFEAQRLSARAGYRMANIDLELHKWNRIQKRDKLIGCSFTGFQDFVNITKLNSKEQENLLYELKCIAKQAANEYATELGENKPLLVTTIKPEGTLSCVAGGVSSGIHYSHAPYYIRRIRISKNDALLKACEELGYKVFYEVGEDENNYTRKVVEFPLKAPEGKTKYDISALEQLELYKKTMKYYTEHNTSITVSVRENEWGDVEKWMIDNCDDVIGISFLSLDNNFYQLAPFEAITKD